MVARPLFALVNLAGLSLGLTAFILILQYVAYEKSVNAFHQHAPSLHRVLMQYKDGAIGPLTPPGLADVATQALPEVARFCRVAEGANLGHGIVAAEGSSVVFREDQFAYADGNFFDLFSFRISRGDAGNLQKPNTVAIAQSQARKYFGSANPVGRTLTLSNQFGTTLYTIVAVYDDIPENSDMRYPLVFSLSTLGSKANLNGNEQWASLDGLGSAWMLTWLQLHEGSAPAEVAGKLAQAMAQRSTDSGRDVLLQPLTEVHLAPSLSSPLPTTGSLAFVYLLMALALLIILIAWFNYVNLATATGLKQAKEIGIRKVSGASRSQLILHLLGESAWLNAASVALALGLVNLFQPLFNSITGVTLSMATLTSTGVWLAGLFLVVIGTLLSGAYTAFALSGYRPSQIIKGNFSHSVSGIQLRKVLVVAQFSISVFLLGATWVLYRQLAFLQDKNLGIELNQLMVIQGPETGKDETFKDRTNAFTDALQQFSFVGKFCRTASVPLDGYNFSTSGITRLVPQPGDENISYAIMMADHRYFDTYSMRWAAGTGFTEEMGNQKFSDIDRIVINETAALKLGFASHEQAVGEKIKMGDQEFTVIGVIADYHHLSLHQAIEPILFLPSQGGGMYTVQMATQGIQANLSQLEKLYRQYFPGNPFTYYFLDDAYRQLYDKEMRYGQLFTLASVLAMAVACLGLFGLATFTVEQRTKEIGIRKVMGASVAQITQLLSKDFLRLVLLAILIATPLTWWAMKTWLEGFAYRTELTLSLFMGAGALAVVLSWATVATRAIKAAWANPVDSLRNE